MFTPLMRVNGYAGGPLNDPLEQEWGKKMVSSLIANIQSTARVYGISIKDAYAKETQRTTAGPVILAEVKRQLRI